MIAGPAREDDQTILIPARQVIGAGNLEGRFDGLRAAADRVETGVIHGQMGSDGCRVRLDGLGGECAPVGVTQTPGLGRHDVGD